LLLYWPPGGTIAKYKNGIFSLGSIYATVTK